MVVRTLRARNVLGSRAIEDYLSSESSESEFVEGEEKPWPVEGERAGRPRRRAPHYPRPHSHLVFRVSSGGGRACGNKHARRYENCTFQ